MPIYKKIFSSPRIMGVNIGFLAFILYLTTWHLYFEGYELETMESALKLLEGEFAIRRAGITASFLYLPFIIFFKLLGLKSIAWLTIVPLVFSMLTIVILYFTVLLLTNKRHIALLISFIVATGSSIWPYTNIGMEYQAMFFLALLLMSLLQWEKERCSLITPGIVFALLCTAKSYGSIFGIPFILFVYAVNRYKNVNQKKQYKDICIALLPGIIAATIALLVQYTHYNSFSGFYSLAHEFQISMWWEGFYGIFFSMGKSIFLFNPLLIISLFGWVHFYKNHKPTALFILASFTLLLLITAPFDYWSDETWAVRKLIPVIPLLHLPLLSLLYKKNRIRRNIPLSSLFVAVLVTSIYIQVLGASYHYEKQLNALRNGNLDSLNYIRFTPPLSHIPLYNKLFVNNLLDKKAVLLYNEGTWFRWTKQESDIFFRKEKIDLSTYQMPDIVWIRKGKRFIFYTFLIVDILLIFFTLLIYTNLRKLDR